LSGVRGGGVDSNIGGGKNNQVDLSIGEKEDQIRWFVEKKAQWNLSIIISRGFKEGLEGVALGTSTSEEF